MKLWCFQCRQGLIDDLKVWVGAQTHTLINKTDSILGAELSCSFTCVIITSPSHLHHSLIFAFSLCLWTNYSDYRVSLFLNSSSSFFVFPQSSHFPSPSLLFPRSLHQYPAKTQGKWISNIYDETFFVSLLLISLPHKKDTDLNRRTYVVIRQTIYPAIHHRHSALLCSSRLPNTAVKTTETSSAPPAPESASIIPRDASASPQHSSNVIAMVKTAPKTPVICLLLSEVNCRRDF